MHKCKIGGSAKSIEREYVSIATFYGVTHIIVVCQHPLLCYILQMLLHLFHWFFIVKLIIFAHSQAPPPSTPVHLSPTPYTYVYENYLSSCCIYKECVT